MLSESLVSSVGARCKLAMEDMRQHGRTRLQSRHAVWIMAEQRHSPHLRSGEKHLLGLLDMQERVALLKVSLLTQQLITTYTFS